MILITGGAGFIGSNFILEWLQHHQEPVVNFDALTYAGNPENLNPVKSDPRYRFVLGNVADASATKSRYSLCGGKPCGPFDFRSKNLH